MIVNETPRTRSLLRQANRNVEGGKFAAAEKLYRQIIAETPNSVSAWLGLAKVVQAESDKQAAFEQVLLLDEDNAEAKAGLALLHGEVPEPSDDNILANQVIVEEPLSGAAEEQSDLSDDQISVATTAVAEASAIARTPDSTSDMSTAVHMDEHAVVHDPDVDLFCYRHPNRSTSLRCYKCNKPICSTCAVKTPVGYLCPDCQREAEDAFFNAKTTDYLLALLVALPVSLLAGWLVVRFSGGIFMILLFVFAGGAVGGFIARLAKRVMGNRRGRYIPHLVAACIIIGVMVWAWPWVLYLLAGNAGILFKLAGIGVYLFTAASSAFYWAR